MYIILVTIISLFVYSAVSHTININHSPNEKKKKTIFIHFFFIFNRFEISYCIFKRTIPLNHLLHNDQPPSIDLISERGFSEHVVFGRYVFRFTKPLLLLRDTHFTNIKITSYPTKQIIFFNKFQINDNF